jgi:uncharacterized protein YPO0396
MADLFTETGNEGGFRLERLELYNWGGFNAKIFHLQPGCQNSLITGANGSGKTTVVDALVSLLVPPRNRHFNQSSGNDRRRDRTEESYVRGAYGTTRDESSLSSRVRYHRPDKKSTVSVLLAAFSNSLSPEPTCLVQIRWFGATTGRLETRYIISKESLTIVDDFAEVDPRGEYLRNLKKVKNVEVFDSFTAYAKAFRLRFGMRSEKALTLFNKTVGVKDIDDLNEFIRSQMLDEVETEEEFSKLKDHYNDLLKAHRQIELAEERIGLLEEVERQGTEYKSRLADYNEAREALDSLQFAVASFRRDLAAKESDELQRNISSLNARLERLSSNLSEKRETQKDIAVALQSNEAMGQLRELEHSLELKRRQAERTRKDYDAFAADANTAGMQAPTNKETFDIQRHVIDEKVQGLLDDENQAKNRHLNLGIDRNRSQEKLSDIKEELQSLEGRRTNIPRKSVEIRDRIVQSLGWTTEELPFAGELMRIRSGEDRWQLAAEHLLHPMALSLLVSDSNYSTLTDYVNRHDMRGKVVFFRIRDNLEFDTNSHDSGENPDHLYHKIEVKNDTPFSRWIEERLVDRYAYVCTDDNEVFRHTDYAITSKGLIKSAGIRHEKDDRPNRFGKGRSVLGWDNRGKIAHLRGDTIEAENQLKKTEEELANLETNLKEIRDILGALKRLLNIRDFTDIDWFSIEAECKDIELEIHRLRESDDELSTLRSSLEAIESEIKDLENNERELVDNRGRLRHQLEGVREEQDAAEVILESESPESIGVAVDRFREVFKDQDEAKSLGELRRKESGWTGSLNARVQEATNRLGPVRTALTRAMGRYLRPGSEIQTRFPDWNSETTHLRDEISFLPEYESLLARLRDEDLPGYKVRFREYMNRRMSESLVGFSTLLDSADRGIDSYIRDLNKSLKKLPYDKAQNTYIALNKESNTDPVIRDFRNLLRGSHPDQGRLVQDDIQELEAAFDRIRNLIERLDEDQSWRRKVLDVRNWSRFSAGEYYREDDSLKQYYEASGSLSGGEKAKLAYTILASALAYQYGLQDDPVRSFRFIVVDEIFSKVDPRNAEYAMDLFKNLNLQVMVVTPLDNIRLVEDHISTVHFAERGTGDLARIHDISIEEVRLRRIEREAV